MAQIGRLLAVAVSRWLSEKRELPAHVETNDIGDIVYAACLAHDIGNPPFGHSGEEAIQSWFKKNSDRPLLKDAMSSDDTRNDFLFLMEMLRVIEFCVAPKIGETRVG